MKRKTNRQDRIADLIQQSLAESLLRRVSDERFKLVTVTGVSISKDLSYAKVFVSVLVPDEEIKSVVKALNNAAKLLRHYLAQDIQLRIVPELKFTYDESIARGTRISSLINNALLSDDHSDKSNESDNDDE